MRLRNKIAVVTGGGTGMGRELCRRLREADERLCRAKIDACDIPDFCNGVDVDCPFDEKVPRCGCGLGLQS